MKEKDFERQNRSRINFVKSKSSAKHTYQISPNFAGKGEKRQENQDKTCLFSAILHHKYALFFPQKRKWIN